MYSILLIEIYLKNVPFLQKISILLHLIPKLSNFFMASRNNVYLFYIYIIHINDNIHKNTKLNYIILPYALFNSQFYYSIIKKVILINYFIQILL